MATWLCVILKLIAELSVYFWPSAAVHSLPDHVLWSFSSRKKVWPSPSCHPWFCCLLVTSRWIIFKCFAVNGRLTWSSSTFYLKSKLKHSLAHFCHVFLLLRFRFLRLHYIKCTASGSSSDVHFYGRTKRQSSICVDLNVKRGYRKRDQNDVS